MQKTRYRETTKVGISAQQAAMRSARRGLPPVQGLGAHLVERVPDALVLVALDAASGAITVERQFGEEMRDPRCGVPLGVFIDVGEGRLLSSCVMAGAFLPEAPLEGRTEELRRRGGGRLAAAPIASVGFVGASRAASNARSCSACSAIALASSACTAARSRRVK